MLRRTSRCPPSPPNREPESRKPLKNQTITAFLMKITPVVPADQDQVSESQEVHLEQCQESDVLPPEQPGNNPEERDLEGQDCPHPKEKEAPEGCLQSDESGQAVHQEPDVQPGDELVRDQVGCQGVGVPIGVGSQIHQDSPGDRVLKDNNDHSIVTNPTNQLARADKKSDHK